MWTMILIGVVSSVNRCRTAHTSQSLWSMTSTSQMAGALLVVVSGFLLLTGAILVGTSSVIGTRIETLENDLSHSAGVHNSLDNHRDGKPVKSVEEAMTGTETTIIALREELKLLTLGKNWLSKQAGYTATFLRRESVEKDVSPVDEMQIVVRHEPFAVRLDWLETGRRVAYTDGENDNRLLVRLGGSKRLFGTLKLDPRGRLAMQNSRHPITEIGLLDLTNRLLTRCQQDLEQADKVVCQTLPDEELSGRICAVFVVEYQTPALSPNHRSTQISVDRAWGAPVKMESTGWAEFTTDVTTNESQIVESAEYRNVTFANEISASQFDLTTNPVAISSN